VPQRCRDCLVYSQDTRVVTILPCAQAPGTAMAEHSGALHANGTRIIYVTELSASSSEQARHRALGIGLP